MGLLIPHRVDFPEKYKFQVQGKYDESNKVQASLLIFPMQNISDFLGEKKIDLGCGPSLKSEEEKAAVQLS